MSNPSDSSPRAAFGTGGNSAQLRIYFASVLATAIAVLAGIRAVGQGQGSIWMVLFSLALVLIFVVYFPYRTNTTFRSVISRIILPVLIGLAISYVWYLSPAISVLGLDVSIEGNDGKRIEYFLEIMSVLYAICIAFLLFKGLNDYDNLRHVLREEAACIQSYIEFMMYLDGEGKNGRIIDGIRTQFLTYIDNIYSDNQLTRQAANDRLIMDVITETKRLNTKKSDSDDSIALSEAMKQLAELSRLRGLRESHIDSRMPTYLLVLLAVLSLSLLAPFMAGPRGNEDLTAVLIFSLSTFFSFFYIALLDLNEPNDGYWKIKIEAFKTVRKFITDDISRYNQATPGKRKMTKKRA